MHHDDDQNFVFIKIIHISIDFETNYKIMQTSLKKYIFIYCEIKKDMLYLQ